MLMGSPGHLNLTALSLPVHTQSFQWGRHSHASGFSASQDSGDGDVPLLCTASITETLETQLCG